MSSVSPEFKSPTSAQKLRCDGHASRWHAALQYHAHLHAAHFLGASWSQPLFPQRWRIGIFKLSKLVL